MATNENLLYAIIWHVCILVSFVFPVIHRQVSIPCVSQVGAGYAILAKASEGLLFLLPYRWLGGTSHPHLYQFGALKCDSLEIGSLQK